MEESVAQRVERTLSAVKSLLVAEKKMYPYLATVRKEIETVLRANEELRSRLSRLKRAVIDSKNRDVVG